MYLKPTLSRAYLARLEARLLGCIDFGVSPAGCWLWTGYRFRDGYGGLRVSGQRRPAHRVAYELLAGEIPDGLQLDHLCRERACVNPLHLEPVTASENKRRGSNRNTDKTHCDSGHPFDADNTYQDPRGWRGCRACRRKADRRRYQGR